MREVMTFFQWIKEKLQKQGLADQEDTSFAFPYSSDQVIKRQQIWNNLQRGLLFEDTQTFLPWETSYANLDRYKEKREDSGDRVNWFLGKHMILDGYECNVEVMKWSWIEWHKPFSEIDTFLGFESEGNENFNGLKDKITDLLGDPVEMKLERFGDLDLGVIKWTNKKATISIVGIEQFACKYWLHIGLTNHRKY